MAENQVIPAGVVPKPPVKPKTEPVPPRKVLLWAFRDLRGSKEKLIAAINASDAPDEEKTVMIARLNKLTGDGFRLDSMGMSAHDGELLEHTQIAQIM